MLGYWKQCGTVSTSVSQRLLCYSLVPQSVPLSGGCELLDGERPTWRLCCWRKLLSFVLFFPWTSPKPWDEEVLLPWHIAFSVIQRKANWLAWVDSCKAETQTATSLWKSPFVSGILYYWANRSMKPTPREVAKDCETQGLWSNSLISFANSTDLDSSGKLGV